MHLSVPDNHRVRAASDPRKTTAFPRRAPSCVDLLALSPHWPLAISPRGFFAQSPRHQLKSAKRDSRHPCPLIKPRVIIADTDSVNSRSVGGGRLAYSGLLFFRALSRISGKCHQKPKGTGLYISGRSRRNSYRRGRLFAMIAGV